MLEVWWIVTYLFSDTVVYTKPKDVKYIDDKIKEYNQRLIYTDNDFEIYVIFHHEFNDIENGDQEIIDKIPIPPRYGRSPKDFDDALNQLKLSRYIAGIKSPKDGKVQVYCYSMKDKDIYRQFGKVQDVIYQTPQLNSKNIINSLLMKTKSKLNNELLSTAKQYSDITVKVIHRDEGAINIKPVHILETKNNKRIMKVGNHYGMDKPPTFLDTEVYEGKVNKNNLFYRCITGKTSSGIKVQDIKEGVGNFHNEDIINNLISFVLPNSYDKLPISKESQNAINKKHYTMGYLRSGNVMFVKVQGKFFKNFLSIYPGEKFKIKDITIQANDDIFSKINSQHVRDIKNIIMNDNSKFSSNNTPKKLKKYIKMILGQNFDVSKMICKDFNGGEVIIVCHITEVKSKSLDNSRYFISNIENKSGFPQFKRFLDVFPFLHIKKEKVQDINHVFRSLYSGTPIISSVASNRNPVSGTTEYTLCVEQGTQDLPKLLEWINKLGFSFQKTSSGFKLNLNPHTITNNCNNIKLPFELNLGKNKEVHLGINYTYNIFTPRKWYGLSLQVLEKFEYEAAKETYKKNIKSLGEFDPWKALLNSTATAVSLSLHPYNKSKKWNIQLSTEISPKNSTKNYLNVDYYDNLSSSFKRSLSLDLQNSNTRHNTIVLGDAFQISGNIKINPFNFSQHKRYNDSSDNNKLQWMLNTTCKYHNGPWQFQNTGVIYKLLRPNISTHIPYEDLINMDTSFIENLESKPSMVGLRSTNLSFAHLISITSSLQYEMRKTNLCYIANGYDISHSEFVGISAQYVHDNMLIMILFFKCTINLVIVKVDLKWNILPITRGLMCNYTAPYYHKELLSTSPINSVDISVNKQENNDMNAQSELKGESAHRIMESTKALTL